MRKFITLIMLGSPLLLKAQGFQVNLQGQKQQGMGNTGTAFIQDGAAAFYNPGGVSFLKENSVQIGGSPVISKGVYRDAASSVQSETKSPVSWPFAAYGVWGPKQSKFKFALAAYTPFGSTATWQDGWTGRFITTNLKLFSVFIQPTVSYKINDKWGVGAGFVYGIGHVELAKDLPVQDQAGKYGSAKLNGNANGVGFNAGVYYKPTQKFSVGLTYRSQVNMKVNSGTVDFSVPASLSSNFPNGPFSSKLPLPKVITLGFAYVATQKLTLALDINYIGWKAYDTLSFDYEKNTPVVQDTKSPRDYKNTFAFRAGGQYKINEKLDARLGIAYQLTPIKNGYVTPEVPDANRFVYSAGVGYKINKRFTVDASFTFEHFERNNTNIENHLSGTYEMNLFVPGVSVSYNF